MAGDRRYYGTQKGQRDIANKNMIGSQVLRSIYQGNSRFKKEVLAQGVTREMDEVKKRVPVSYTHLTLPTTPYV